MIYVIGVGGVGSWLASAIARLESPNFLVLVDGDDLEEKNLDRQLFTPDEIGENKADALAKRLKCKSHGGWFDAMTFTHTDRDWLLVCVDNNAARSAALRACDTYGCAAIFAANETTSSEAYVYLPQWKGTENDPRVYYPEIETDESNNPMRAAIGCTGEAQLKNRQLVTANFMAAGLAGHLYMLWAIEARQVKPEVRRFMPHRLNQNLTRNGFVLSGEPKLVEKRKQENGTRSNSDSSSSSPTA